LNNNEYITFAGGWKQLQHAKNINSTLLTDVSLPASISWFSNGMSYLIVNSSGVDEVRQYTVPTAYNTTGSTFVTAFSINDQESNARGLYIHPDDTKFYILGTTSRRIFQYNMTSPRDLSTASYSGIDNGFVISLTNPQGFTIAKRGTKVYIVDATDNIMAYNMPTPYDITTLSAQIATLSIITNTEDPRDIIIKADGTMIYIGSAFYNTVSRYILKISFNINTMVFVDELDISAFTTAIQGMFIRPHNGELLYVIGADNDTIHTFEMLLKHNNTIITNLGEELVTNLQEVLVYA